MSKEYSMAPYRVSLKIPKDELLVIFCILLNSWPLLQKEGYSATFHWLGFQSEDTQT
jgi:hypothetical protein